MSKAKRGSQENFYQEEENLAETMALNLAKESIGTISLVSKVLEETILQKGAEELYNKYL